MSTINNLSPTDRLAAGDMLVGYIQNQGSARAISLNLLLAFMQANLVLSSTRAAAAYKATSFTLAPTESALICIGTAAIVASLPAAGLYPGRTLHFKNLSAFAVTSDTANVVPLAGTTPGNSIMTAGAGKWATLVSDGAFWIIMAGN